MPMAKYLGDEESLFEFQVLSVALSVRLSEHGVGVGGAEITVNAF